LLAASQRKGRTADSERRSGRNRWLLANGGVGYPRDVARAIAHRRLIATIGVAIVAFATLAGTAGQARGATTYAWPVQSLGDRGTDVAAIQQLLRAAAAGSSLSGGAGRSVVVRGIDPAVAPIDGLFGPATGLGVRAFQTSRGLPRTGIVDAATWSELAPPLGPGAQGDAVAALQRELREKTSASAVPIDGVFGTSTVLAVKAFQAHMALAQTGSVDATTWRLLVWHYELPRFGTTALCDYSAGNGPANWGTAETIATIEAAGRSMVGAGYGRVAVGDVSFELGGPLPGHETHRQGLDVDLRLMRKANDQCSARTRWSLTTYDRTATRALILAIRAATPGHVKLIYFNDPVLISEGLTTPLAGHDDHLHVRICEAWHPDPAYRC
jgi:peptidoglycan hydrolase-like protein with peptidoglycan-binding domain